MPDINKKKLSLVRVYTQDGRCDLDKILDILLKNNDSIPFGDKELIVIETPGHTPGSICLKVDNHVFTGDTLFYLSVGRTDLGMGDQQALQQSINEKLLTLPDETIIYPGHGKQSTIGYEKKHNTFI